MKRARSCLSTPVPTLHSVDPIDLRALSDELDLSDMMRQTVISTIDEWAETPVSPSSNTTSVTSTPSLSHLDSNRTIQPVCSNDEPPHSPVRLWASIRRLWHAVFPEPQPEPQPETSLKETLLEKGDGKSGELNVTENVLKPSQPGSNPFTNLPQTTPRKPRQVTDFFEEDLTETDPLHPVFKLFSEVPENPFRNRPQVSDFFEDHVNQVSYPSPDPVPERTSQKPTDVSNFLDRNPTDASRPSPHVSKHVTKVRQNPFQKPRHVSNILEETPTETLPPTRPVSNLFTDVQQNPFQKPRQVTDFFEESPTGTLQPSRPVPNLFTEVPKNPFQKPRQVTDFFEETPTETLPPTRPAPNLFTEVQQNPFQKTRQVTDFFEEDIKESDVDLSLPTDNELLHLCSRITTPTRQPQRRRITGDPAIDRRLAHLESLRAQIRERRENDKQDEDFMRRRRRQRLIEEQRRIASSLRVQRMAGVPRNVKLPVPTKRSRLAKLKDARARGGVNSPTGIFEVANGFRTIVVHPRREAELRKNKDFAFLHVMRILHSTSLHSMSKGNPLKVAFKKPERRIIVLPTFSDVC